MSDKKELDFENSLRRLEDLVAKMESGELSLEQMISHFEEGSQLVENCNARLTEVEKRIEKLVKTSSGEMGTELFLAAEE